MSQATTETTGTTSATPISKSTQRYTEGLRKSIYDGRVRAAVDRVRQATSDVLKAEKTRALKGAYALGQDHRQDLRNALHDVDALHAAGVASVTTAELAALINPTPKEA